MTEALTPSFALACKLLTYLKDKQFADQFTLYDLDHIGPGMLASHAVISEDPYSLPLFSRYAPRRPGSALNGSSFFYSKNAAPFCLRLYTTNRLQALELVNELVPAIQAERLVQGVSVDFSWTWDHQNCTAKNRPTYRKVYLIDFWLSEMPKKQKEDLTKYICAAKDPRADRCMFQLADEVADGEHLLCSYQHVSDGIIIAATSASALEKFIGLVFSDVKVEPVKNGAKHSVKLCLA